MKSILSIICVLICFHLSIDAQTYDWAKPVNALDSGQITAHAVSPNGDIYVASYIKAVTMPFLAFGVNGVTAAGIIKLSKLDSNGVQVWSKTFGSSRARIFELKLDINHNVIIGGGYYDSLKLAPTAQYAGDSILSSAFIAKFTSSGVHIWSKIHAASSFTSHVSYTFELSDTVIIESGIFYDDYGLRKLNSVGDTIKTLKFIIPRLASDIEIDPSGNIYIGLNSFTSGYIDTVAIPTPPNNTNYLNVLAKLNSDLRCLWARSTNYITLDNTVEVELFSNQVAMMSNDYPNGSSGAHQFNIKYYNPAGTLQI